MEVVPAPDQRRHRRDEVEHAAPGLGILADAVRTADGVPAAKLELEGDEFDVVITDVQMPGGSGLDLLRLAQGEAPETVVIVMTAFASTKFRWGPTLALAAGATLFCSLVFVKGLGVPLPLVGKWFGG